MKLAAFALFAAILARLFGALVPGPVFSDERYAVAHVTNNTGSDLSLYHGWRWNSETSQESAQVNWRMTVIPPGQVCTVYFPYDGTTKASPDLIVVFDSDRDDREHWQMVKLAQGASADYKDGTSGFAYALEYDNNRHEYASLRPKNGGTITVLDFGRPAQLTLRNNRFAIGKHAYSGTAKCPLRTRKEG